MSFFFSHLSLQWQSSLDRSRSKISRPPEFYNMTGSASSCSLKAQTPRRPLIAEILKLPAFSETVSHSHKAASHKKPKKKAHSSPLFVGPATCFKMERPSWDDGTLLKNKLSAPFDILTVSSQRYSWQFGQAPEKKQQLSLTSCWQADPKTHITVAKQPLCKSEFCISGGPASPTNNSRLI